MSKQIEKSEKIKLAKAELNSYYDLYLKVSHLKDFYSELKEQMNSCRITKYDDEVRGTAPNDSVEELFDKLHKIEREIAQGIWKMQDRRLELTKRINSALLGDCADVLYRVYIDREKFEEIAIAKSFCYRQIVRMHRKALLVYYDTWLQNCP